MRRRFPADRLTFMFGQQPYAPLRNAAGTELVVCTDQTASIAANIVNLDGTPILGSRLVIGLDSMLPEFLGTDDGARVLWARRSDGAVFPLYANLEDQLVEVVTAPSEIFIGPSPPIDPVLQPVWIDTSGLDIP